MSASPMEPSAEQPGKGEEQERDLLEVLVSMELQALSLESLLERLSKNGHIGSFSPAGAARTAMLATALALEPKDMLFGTARDVPAALGHGVSLRNVLAQALGKATDPGRGRGLPGAITSAHHRVSLTDGNVASHTVHAAGFGQAAQLRGDPLVACALLGSGALANGEVHGGFGFAALGRSRTIFVVRGPVGDGVDLSEAGDAWGLPVEVTPGDDGQAVFHAVRQARERALRGEGPSLIDARLPREPRPLDWRAHQDRGGWSAEQRQAVGLEVERALHEARSEVEADEDLPLTSLLEDVFAERPWFLRDEQPHEVIS